MKGNPWCLALLVPILIPAVTLGDQIPPGGAQTSPNGVSPVVGVWRLLLPNQCTETYTYGADGVLNVTSGEETAQSNYTIDSSVRPSGFYKMVDTVVKTNGKPDCFGELTPIGDVAAIFVRFDAGAAKMLMCLDESSTRCVGPAVRQSGT